MKSTKMHTNFNIIITAPIWQEEQYYWHCRSKRRSRKRKYIYLRLVETIHLILHWRHHLSFPNHLGPTGGELISVCPPRASVISTLELATHEAFPQVTLHRMFFNVRVQIRPLQRNQPVADYSTFLHLIFLTHWRLNRMGYIWWQSFVKYLPD